MYRLLALGALIGACANWLLGQPSRDVAFAFALAAVLALLAFTSAASQREPLWQRLIDEIRKERER